MFDTLNSILDTHPDLICRMDKDLVFTYANQAAASFFNLSKDAVIGKHLLFNSDADESALIRELLSRITFANPSVESLKRFDRPSGTQYIQFHTLGLFDSDEKLTGYQCFGRDLTREIILKRELEDQKKELDKVQIELRSVLDTVPALIWYKDDKNNILRLNQAAATSMGMRVEDVEGQNTYDLFGETAKDYHEADLKVFRSGIAIRGMIEPYTPDTGEQRWVQTDKIPFSDGADGPRILVVSTDITSLKEQEAILKSINKNLDDFASLTSHDLQAPLRKIGITAELMQMELGDSLPDDAATYFDDIAQGVDRMRQLIKSFLKFMRSSPEGVELGDVDLYPLLRRVAEEEKGLLDEVGGVLRLPDMPVHVRGDEALLGQVFSNLISNAIKYRDPSRPVEIDIQARQDKQDWVITICDNGSGIDPSFADQVFDLFGRAKPHMNIEGSGIGLALCRRIITLHGGTIELINKDTKGSCFEIKLFRARSAADG